MARAATKQKEKQASLRQWGLLYKYSLNDIDRESVVAILGDVSVRTLADVGRAFGVRHATVKVNWRPAGMPGSNGSYSLLDIFVWLKKRDKENEKQSTGSDHGNRMRELELREKELDLEKKEMRNRREQGGLVDILRVREVFGACISVFREGLLSIPRQLEPAHGKASAAECDRLIRHQLTAFSEKSQRDIIAEGAGDDL